MISDIQSAATPVTTSLSASPLSKLQGGAEPGSTGSFASALRGQITPAVPTPTTRAVPAAAVAAESMKKSLLSSGAQKSAAPTSSSEPQPAAPMQLLDAKGTASDIVEPDLGSSSDDAVESSSTPCGNDAAQTEVGSAETTNREEDETTLQVAKDGSDVPASTSEPTSKTTAEFDPKSVSTHHAGSGTHLLKSETKRIRAKSSGAADSTMASVPATPQAEQNSTSPAGVTESSMPAVPPLSSPADGKAAASGSLTTVSMASGKVRGKPSGIDKGSVENLAQPQPSQAYAEGEASPTTLASPLEEKRSASGDVFNLDKAVGPVHALQQSTETLQVFSIATTSGVSQSLGATFSHSLHSGGSVKENAGALTDPSALVDNNRTTLTPDGNAVHSTKRLEVAIDDPDLGRMNVQAELRNGQLHATLTASDAVVSSAPALHHFLREQAVSVHDLTFSVINQPYTRSAANSSDANNSGFSFAGNSGSAHQRPYQSSQARVLNSLQRGYLAEDTSGPAAVLVGLLERANYRGGLSIHV